MAIGEYIEVRRPSRLLFTLGMPQFAADFDTVTVEIEKAKEEKIRAAYLPALSRRPTPTETALSLEHLDKQEGLYRKANVPAREAASKALASLARMLLASNEFLYVE